MIIAHRFPPLALSFGPGATVCLDDHAAFLASVYGGSSIVRLRIFEFIKFLSRRIKTFRTESVPDLVRIDGQMALPATQSLFSSRQQFERGVIAGFHGKRMNRIAGDKMRRALMLPGGK